MFSPTVVRDLVQNIRSRQEISDCHTRTRTHAHPHTHTHTHTKKKGSESCTYMNTTNKRKKEQNKILKTWHGQCLLNKQKITNKNTKKEKKRKPVSGVVLKQTSKQNNNKKETNNA